MKTNRFKYLAAAILSIAVLASPAYGQKIYAKASLSTNTPRVDADDEQAQPNAYQLFGHGDPKLDSLSRQLDHYGKLLHDYNHSKTYETLNARAKGFSTTTVHSFYGNVR